jgi:hypothetical protein
MAMNPKDFTVEAAKSYLEKEYPFVNIYENLTKTDKINTEKLANAAREKIKNPSSKVWDSMIKEQAAPMETPYGKSFLSYTPEGKIKMIEDLKSVTKSDAGRGLGSLGRKLVGPAVAAGEVAAGENDIGKLAAGYVGADVMGELGAAAGGLLGKGPGAVAGALGGSLGGYAAGQKLYDKYAPEGVKKAMSISPEERLKVKQLLQDLKSKVKLTK